MIEYHRQLDCASFFHWIFSFYRGVTKLGDREWYIRIFGITILNKLEE